MENKRDLSWQIATVLGAGESPIASGTVGSFFGLGLVYFFQPFIIPYLIVFIILFFAGVIASGKVEDASREKDPHVVVIDEFACIFPVFMGLERNWWIYLVGFILYRVFDIIKPPPARSLEALPGGWGIMLDDLVAGIYAHLILRVVLFVFNL